MLKKIFISIFFLLNFTFLFSQFKEFQKLDSINNVKIIDSLATSDRFSIFLFLNMDGSCTEINNGFVDYYNKGKFGKASFYKIPCKPGTNILFQGNLLCAKHNENVLLITPCKKIGCFISDSIFFNRRKQKNISFNPNISMTIRDSIVSKINFIKDSIASLKISSMKITKDTVALINTMKITDDTKKLINKIKFINDSLKKLFSNFNLLNARIDLLSHPPKDSSFLGFNVSFSKSSFNNINSEISITNNISLNYFQLFYSHYFKPNDRIGFNVGMGYLEIDGNAEINNKSHLIVDTINRFATDYNGDKYIRICYGDGIFEKFTIKYMSTFANISIIPFMSKKSFISINPGIKISNLISSYYNGSGGTISYGGYYPQYSKKDTSFSGLYDFYQNKPVFNKRQPLKLNNTSISAIISIEGSTALSSKIYLSVGGFYEKGLTNILNNVPKDKYLSYTAGEYNSLLYRSDKIKINSYGAKVGLAYRF